MMCKAALILICIFILAVSSNGFSSGSTSTNFGEKLKKLFHAKREADARPKQHHGMAPPQDKRAT